MDKSRDEMEKVTTLVNSKSKNVYQLTSFIKKLKPNINYILRMYLKFVFHYPNYLDIFFFYFNAGYILLESFRGTSETIKRKFRCRPWGSNPSPSACEVESKSGYLLGRCKYHPLQLAGAI